MADSVSTDSISAAHHPVPAAWPARVGTLSTLDDGTVRGALDFEPLWLGPVAAALGAPGTAIALSPLNGIYSIVSVSRGIRKTLVDGTVRVLHDVDAQYRWRAFPLLGMPGETVVVALLDPSVLRFQQSAAHGEAAAALWRARFFLRPAVWQALGGLAAYDEFLRGRPCAQPGAAHGGEVEPVTLQGSPYYRLPLCAVHRGYGLDPHRWPGGIAHLRRLLEMHWGEWAHRALKTALGQERLRDTPPALILDWARAHRLAEFLPAKFAAQTP